MARRKQGDRDAGWGPLIDRRAQELWPRIDSRALRRCAHDPRRIAVLVSHRTSLSVEVIIAMLTRPRVSDVEAITWFG
jgi:hypothetical protein